MLNTSSRVALSCVLLSLGQTGCGTVSSRPKDAGEEAGSSQDAVGTDQSKDSADAGTGTIDAAQDASTPPAARCNPAKSFGAPAEVVALNISAGLGSYGVRLTTDERTAFFSGQTMVGSSDIVRLYVATRSDGDATFGTPRLLGVDGSSASPHAWPMASADGLSLFLAYRPDLATTNWRISLATRTSNLVDFTAPAQVSIINGDATVSNDQPWILDDGRIVYFSSNRSGGTDIYRSERDAGGFLAPVAVSSINTSSHDETPIVSSDERTMYFSSDRSGGGTEGIANIWQARRSSATGAFGAPTPVAELNGELPSAPDWVAADDCVIYFHRYTPSENRNRIFMATRGQ